MSCAKVVSLAEVAYFEAVKLRPGRIVRLRNRAHVVRESFPWQGSPDSEPEA